MTRILRPSSFVCLVSVLALLSGASPAGALPVEHIPSPRPAGWSVDLTGTIPAEIRHAVDALGDRIKAENGAEIAVVWIDSTGGVASRDFATRLANFWGIGEIDKNNGILLLAALEDRSAEIVLGRGLDNPSNVRASEEIMQWEMIPRFRAGDPGGALLEGARACARRILGETPPVAETATPALPLTPDPGRFRAEAPMAPPADAAPEAFRPVRSGSGRSPLGMILAGLGLIGGGYYLLRRAPRCSQCRTAMTLIAEREDDVHLTPPEVTEERIGAVDHQIWLCPSCGEMGKRSLPGLLPGYSRCAHCRAKAVESRSGIIENPTSWSTGTRRVDTSCAHCGHESSYTVVIPRLEESRDDETFEDSSPHRSFGSTPSSSSSSSPSSSSSSGSSGFGGGSSSGGGASGRW